MKAILIILVVPAAISIGAPGAAAHHGNKGEHAQPAAARGGCAWGQGEKKYKSRAECLKRNSKRYCTSACK